MTKVLRIINRFNLGGPTYNVAYLAKYMSKDYETLLIGGAKDNTEESSDFILENLAIQNHVFRAALDTPVKKFMFLGSSCIYPKNSLQPIKEEYLLTGPLEPTNEPYAIAKIAGLKTAENIRKQYNREFVSVMPTNLYGIHDNYHPENSHVIPGLIARMQKAIDDGASSFSVWGSGLPKREFLYVDDMASACVYLMEKKEIPDWLNIGTGHDIKVGDLAAKIATFMGFKGTLIFDTSKPDGMMEKRLDVEKLFALGWRPKIDLDEGLKRSINFYRQHILK